MVVSCCLSTCTDLALMLTSRCLHKIEITVLLFALYDDASIWLQLFFSFPLFSLAILVVPLFPGTTVLFSRHLMLTGILLFLYPIPIVIFTKQLISCMHRTSVYMAIHFSFEETIYFVILNIRYINKDFC